MFLANIGGYGANFARMGFCDHDVSTLSDHPVDEVVAWGGAEAIARRISAHQQAGAGHVILAALHDEGQPGALDAGQGLACRFRNTE